MNNMNDTKWPFPTTMSEVITTVDKTITETIEDLKKAWPFPKGTITISEPQEEVEMTEPATLTATKKGIKFVHFDIDKKTCCTVAYRPCKPDTPGMKMLEVAVTYKHPKDQYNKKLGSMTAAGRFLNGRTICMPLRGRNNDETYWNLYHAFVVATDRQ